MATPKLHPMPQTRSLLTYRTAKTGGIDFTYVVLAVVTFGASLFAPPEASCYTVTITAADGRESTARGSSRRAAKYAALRLIARQRHLAKSRS